MRPVEWHADDTLWEALYPFLSSGGRSEAGRAESAEIVRLTGVSRGQLLDLGCGAGRHAIPFREAGFQVTAVDRSAFLLDKAAQEAARRSVSVEWVREDMRTFERAGAFDLVICMLSAYGYFEDDAENRRVLENVCRSLRDGGRFVLDVMGKELLASVFQPTGSESIPGVGTHFAERAWAADFTKLENKWTFVSEAGDVKRYFVRHWVYSARELELMLRDAGFRGVRFFGGLAGEPYSPGAGRLIALSSRT